MNKLIKISGILAMALGVGAADAATTSLSSHWWEPFLSPALIVSMGIFLYNRDQAVKKKEKDDREELQKSINDAVRGLDSIEQLLNGYNETGGLLHQLETMTQRSLDEGKRRHEMANHMQLLQSTLEDIQVWATRVGFKLDLPYDRRHGTR